MWLGNPISPHPEPEEGPVPFHLVQALNPVLVDRHRPYRQGRAELVVLVAWVPSVAWAARASSCPAWSDRVATVASVPARRMPASVHPVDSGPDPLVSDPEIQAMLLRAWVNQAPVQD